MLCNFHTHHAGKGICELVSAAAPPTGGDWSFQALPSAFPNGVPEEFRVPDACAALGEAGLDRRLAMPMQEQVQILEALLKKSGELPVVVHCVRAYPELNAVLKNCRRRVLLHRFAGSEEELAYQIRHGRVISLSASELKRGVGRAFFGASPENLRFLALETDDDPAAEIVEAYRLASELFGVGRARLETVLLGNYKRFTGKNNE